MRVLLADQNKLFLESVQSFLWDRDHEAEIALSGLECMLTMREFVPGVLLLDRDLLWGGSFGVLDWMAGKPEFRNTRVIITHTGCLTEKWKTENGLSVELLRKPYRIGELLTCINSISRHKQLVSDMIVRPSSALEPVR